MTNSPKSPSPTLARLADYAKNPLTLAGFGLTTVSGIALAVLMRDPLEHSLSPFRAVRRDRRVHRGRCRRSSMSGRRGAVRQVLGCRDPSRRVPLFLSPPARPGSPAGRIGTNSGACAQRKGKRGAGGRRTGAKLTLGPYFRSQMNTGGPRARARADLGLRAELVLDASPHPVIAVDGRGRIAYASPRVHESFGWAPTELIGQPVEELLPARLAARHVQHRGTFHAHPIARPMGRDTELFGRRRDGTEFPVEISLAPVRSPRGTLTFATIVDITARSGLQAELQHVNEELQHHADELEQRGREMALLAQMGELLESCQTLEEAYRVTASIAEPLFAGDAGAIYAMTTPHASLEAVAVWGNPPPVRSVFERDDCWAIRRGRLHVVNDADPELRCEHVEEPVVSGLLCEPLAAQAETLGLLHVQLRRRSAGKARAALLLERERLVQTLGEQLALALANIRLRGTLREQ